MNLSANIAEVRDGAFQRIGRNVTIFQKMEAMLKFILVYADFSTPASETVRNLERQVARFKSKTMGELVSMTATALHKEPSVAPEGISEVWMSNSVTIEGGKAAASDWRREMNRIVATRNKLIHKTLASFDPNSLASCEAISAELDTQQEQVTQAYGHLEDLVGAIRASHRVLAENADMIVEAMLAEEASHDAQQTVAANWDVQSPRPKAGG